jgi:hypothetical protein
MLRKAVGGRLDFRIIFELTHKDKQESFLLGSYHCI